MGKKPESEKDQENILTLTIDCPWPLSPTYQFVALLMKWDDEQRRLTSFKW